MGGETEGVTRLGSDGIGRLVDGGGQYIQKASSGKDRCSYGDNKKNVLIHGAASL